MIRPLDYETGYKPDILMLDQAAIGQEPLWAKESII